MTLPQADKDSSNWTSWGLRFHLRNGVDDRGLKGQINKVRALVEEVSTDALRNVALVPARVRGGIAEGVGQMDVR